MVIDGASSPNPSASTTDPAANGTNAAGGPAMPDDATMEAVWALAIQNAMSLGEEAVKQAQEAEKDDEEFAS